VGAPGLFRVPGLFAEAGDDVRVVADCRERRLMRLLPGVESAQLPVGDVLIVAHGRPRLIIERKSAADLAASIKDGRWRDQTRRMREAADEEPGLVACVVVEGDVSSGSNGISGAAMSGALLSASVRRGLCVLYSDGLDGTAEIVRRSCAALKRPPTIRGPPARLPSTSPGPANKGKGKGTGPSCVVLPGRAPGSMSGVDAAAAGAAMLTVVPGVSVEIGRALLGGRESLGAMAADLGGMDRAGRVAVMSETRHGAAGRRVGAALASRVERFLFGGAPPENIE
jgi:hypothetical protein